MRNEIIEVNNVKYIVKIFFENRNNSTISIGKKSINIRIPLSLNRNEQFESIMKMKQWAKEKILKCPPKKEIIKEYKDGDKLAVGDKEYLLSIKFIEKQSSSANIINDSILLFISSKIPEEEQKKHISSLLSRIVAKEIIADLKEKVRKLNEKHFQVKFNKIFFKNLRSIWGSCSEMGNISISTRLLFAPDDVLEYICIHELAHLLEFNHSEKFWSLIANAMPNYQEKELWLNQHGKNITF